jgi:hypothetical protein
MRSYRSPMTGWGKTAATVLVALLLLPVACADQPPPLSARGCRAAWENLRQTQGENGDIAPPGSATSARWQEEYAAARRQERHPDDRATCREDVKAATTRFDRLVQLTAATQEHDMGVQLGWAERDLRHAVSMRDYDPLPHRLAAAFRVLRAEAPAVHEVVVPVEKGAATVDLDDGSAVTALARDITRAATGARGYAACSRALHVIADFQLDEE